MEDYAYDPTDEAQAQSIRDMEASETPFTTAEAVTTQLMDLLTMDDANEIGFEGCRTRTFADRGFMTRDHGFVIMMPDGSEYQITVVKGR